jgi:hypothetical protein
MVYHLGEYTFLPYNNPVGRELASCRSWVLPYTLQRIRGAKSNVGISSRAYSLRKMRCPLHCRRQGPWGACDQVTSARCSPSRTSLYVKTDRVINAIGKGAGSGQTIPVIGSDRRRCHEFDLGASLLPISPGLSDPDPLLVPVSVFFHFGTFRLSRRHTANLALAIELLIDNEDYVIAPLQGPDDYEQVD